MRRARATATRVMLIDGGLRSGRRCGVALGWEEEGGELDIRAGVGQKAADLLRLIVTDLTARRVKREVLVMIGIGRMAVL